MGNYNRVLGDALESASIIPNRSFNSANNNTAACNQLHHDNDEARVQNSRADYLAVTRERSKRETAFPGTWSSRTTSSATTSCSSSSSRRRWFAPQVSCGRVTSVYRVSHRPGKLHYPSAVAGLLRWTRGTWSLRKPLKRAASQSASSKGCEIFV